MKKQVLPERPIELSITNTKSTKTVIEIAAAETNLANPCKPFSHDECINWVSQRLVSVRKLTSRNLAPLHDLYRLAHAPNYCNSLHDSQTYTCTKRHPFLYRILFHFLTVKSDFLHCRVGPNSLKIWNLT